MDITELNSGVPSHDSRMTATDSLESLREQGAARMRIFRYLLGCVARERDRVVDLGAGHCAYSQAARNMGCTVTAVDARTERKPDDAELDAIRFVKADVRQFELAGFDVIVFLGLLYHLELPEQLDILRRCAATNAPVILETQVHVEAMVPESETRAWARTLVRRGDYEGVVFPEGDNPMASIGNSESFWATEPALLAMLRDAGFTQATLVDPLLRSKYGARRFLLLNAGARFRKEQAEVRARDNKIAARVIALAREGQFGAGLELTRHVSTNALVASDPDYLSAVTRAQVHQGDRSAALVTLGTLRTVALGAGDQAWFILFVCAQLLLDAGDEEQARSIWLQAFDHMRNPGQLESLLTGTIKKGASPYGERLISYAEKRFADNPQMLVPVAHARYGLGQFEETVRVCRTALKKDAGNARLLVLLGRALSRQDLTEEAAEAIERARDLEPQNAGALQALIPLLFKLGRWDDAERGAHDLVALAPANPWGHSFLATSFKRKRLRQEALEHARRAAELDPGRDVFRRHVEELAQPAPERARPRRSTTLQIPGAEDPPR
jgi:tetratricopeptide (TPR) repeat protein